MLPSEISSWGSIKVAGAGLMRNCLQGKGGNQGGEVYVKDSRDTRLNMEVGNVVSVIDNTSCCIGTSKFPVLTMFMWQSGAAFEAKLNMYVLFGFGP